MPGHAFGWAIAILLLAALIRGLVQPVVKLGLAFWPSAFAATLISYLVSASVILSTGAIGDRGAIVPAWRAGWRWFVPIGLLNGLAVLTMYAALARGPVAVVAPLVACYPLATLVFSRLLLGSVSLAWSAGVGRGHHRAGRGATAACLTASSFGLHMTGPDDLCPACSKLREGPQWRMQDRGGTGRDGDDQSGRADRAGGRHLRQGRVLRRGRPSASASTWSPPT